MFISIKIEGVDDLLSKLRALPDDVEKKILNKAVHAGGKIILTQAKSNAKLMLASSTANRKHKGMGDLVAKHLKLAAWRKQKKFSYGMGVFIDPAGNSEFVYISKNGKRSYIPAAMEYGHVTAKGTYVAPIPFMRSALDTQGRAATQEIISQISQGIEEANRRM